MHAVSESSLDLEIDRTDSKVRELPTHPVINITSSTLIKLRAMKREQSIVRLKQRLSGALTSPKAIKTSPPRQPSPTTVSEILPDKLYVGANSASYSKAGLLRLDIRHVIRVG